MSSKLIIQILEIYSQYFRKVLIKLHDQVFAQLLFKINDVWILISQI